MASKLYLFIYIVPSKIIKIKNLDIATARYSCGLVDFWSYQRPPLYFSVYYKLLDPSETYKTNAVQILQYQVMVMTGNATSNKKLLWL